jgi:hypothetical protein
MRSIFWAVKNDLQGAFHLSSRNGAPEQAVQEFRSALSKLPHFDNYKFMHDPEPIVKLSNLTEDEIRAFVEEADKFIGRWREVPQ